MEIPCYETTSFRALLTTLLMSCKHHNAYNWIAVASVDALYSDGVRSPRKVMIILRGICTYEFRYLLPLTAGERRQKRSGRSVDAVMPIRVVVMMSAAATDAS